MIQQEDAVSNHTQLSTAAISSRIHASYNRIYSHLVMTRLVYDEASRLCLKCEQEQITGSFKWRGALSKLSTFIPGQKIVTASTGNHGLGVANAAKLYDLTVKIFVSSNAAPGKIDKLHKTGAEIITIEGDSLAAELAGKLYAHNHNLTWVSPYNDLDVIAGQGTIGLELDQQLSSIERVYVTVGGGGLISGIASWMKYHHPLVEVIGCQPENSPEMYLSTQAGHVVTAPDAKETLSDGSAGPLEEDSITFPICNQIVDRYILISEDEIKDAIRHLHAHHNMIIEGAAGVAMAAGMKDQKDGNSVVILCGGNIDPSIHQQICGY